jgi:hypothetical protein
MTRASPLTLTPAQRRDLERLFVAERAGRRALSSHVTTLSMVTSLRRLARLEQLGLLTYSEIPEFYAHFGVLGWHCSLTAGAHEALSRELALGAS